MAFRLFLVEACGEVIPCLRDVELWHYEMVGEGAAESLWFQNDTETSREFCGNCEGEPPERKCLSADGLPCLKLQHNL